MMDPEKVAALAAALSDMDDDDWRALPEAEQRVADERAEAERLRREREAARARQSASRTAWELMADARAAGHVPGWDLRRTMQEFAALDAMMRPSKEMLAVVNAMPKTGLSRADLEANPAFAGIRVDDVVRAGLGAVNTPGLVEAMRKSGALGMTSGDIPGFTHPFKLPRGS